MPVCRDILLRRGRYRPYVYLAADPEKYGAGESVEIREIRREPAVECSRGNSRAVAALAVKIEIYKEAVFAVVKGFSVNIRPVFKVIGVCHIICSVIMGNDGLVFESRLVSKAVARSDLSAVVRSSV